MRFRGLFPGAFLVLTLLWGLGAMLLLAPPAYTDDVGISVAPTTVELTLIPGRAVRHEITVFSQTPHAVLVSTSIGRYGDGTGVRTAVDWLKVEPRQFLIAGFEDRTITITLEAPDGELASGGSYAAVTFDAKSVDPLQDFGATTAQASVPFLINVEGQGLLVRQAALDWFVPVLEPNGLVGFRARLVNRGNVHFLAKGAVEITGQNGLPAWNVEFPESMPVLPESGHVLESSETLMLAKGSTYSAKATITYGGSAAITGDSTFKVSPELRVADLRPVASPDEGIKLVVTLANEGEVALRAVVQVFVRVADGTVLGTTLEAAPGLLLPGTSGDMRYNFSHSLPPGVHVIVAEVYYGGSEQMTHESTFRMGASGPEIVIEPGTATEPAVAAAPGSSDTTGAVRGQRVKRTRTAD